jgi:uncharacterized protein YggU (UPF0235/DUF167 family)
VALIADALGVPKRDVAIVTGARARTKRLVVAGRGAAALDAALAPLLRER